MKVAFSTEALADRSSFRHLTAIWWMFQDSLHRWVVPDLDAVRDSAWLRSEGAELRRRALETAKEVARQVTTPELVVSRHGCATARNGTAWHASPEVAVAHLRQPVTVLVENARIDGEFFRLVVLRVGERKLKRALGSEALTRLHSRWTSPLGDGERLVVRHGGGTTICDQLELTVEAAPGLPPRVFVLVDSDRTGSGAPLGGTAAMVLRTAGDLPDFGCGWRICLFVLGKREVENYLPHEAVRRLSPRPLPNDPDFDDLKAVFGRDIASRVFTADRHLHARALRERCGHDGQELDELIDRLLELM